MALNVKINFEERYKIDTVSDNLSSSSFQTILKDGSNVQLGVQISDEMHPLMPDVYNLAFGPLNEQGEIDDKAKLAHANHSKVFSTILFAGMTFLTENDNTFLGIDGSNNARAYLYYRCIQNNFDYLAKYFKIYGVNYYVRILRKEQEEDQASPIDCENIIALPQLIKAGEHIQGAVEYRVYYMKFFSKFDYNEKEIIRRN